MDPHYPDEIRLTPGQRAAFAQAAAYRIHILPARVIVNGESLQAVALDFDGEAKEIDRTKYFTLDDPNRPPATAGEPHVWGDVLADDPIIVNG